ncbi:ATP synthase F0 subunit C [Acanthopleuribacter pedis]|uniref:ATP synthase subunit c n=1 Tax=Acanthopleuribacter pedis TaxID=442870 RepID=A0A8J7Q9U7_9BACT|nr:ATP synthase F0 subunit C [Acanthopleuribacter pedis]MBO1320094.1 ATP synthase F0 subunit C [Acanthopleuribacter pedis]
MRKFFAFMFIFFTTMFAFGQDGAASAPLFNGPISMAIAASITGLAQGKAIAAACEGIARNPGAAGNIRTTMIIGLALIESLALYTLVIVFVQG